MRHKNRRDCEPPLTGYTRSTTERRRPRLEPAAVVPALVVLLIAVIAVYVVLQDSPARSAASHAAVAKPTAVPGPAGPRADQIGDGTWLVGREVKPGVYRSTAGRLCYWERLSGLSGKYVDLIANGGFRNGPTLVEVLATDYAFGSQGCGRWERVSDQ